MNVRIIAGRFGSRSIKAPRGHATHPMSDRIKGALFNSIGSAVENAEVLDAFSGSGALGFEALSRGAKNVVFVDRDRLAIQTITDNIDTLGCKGETKATQSGVATWADSTDLRFDVIFADPPYGDPQFSTVNHLFGLLKPNGLMVLSYLGRGEVPTELGVVVVDNRSYGDAVLSFYRREDA